jgi:hypothetical protein
MCAGRKPVKIYLIRKKKKRIDICYRINNIFYLGDK